MRAAETVDLLDNIWSPLAIPMPHAGCAVHDDVPVGGRGPLANDFKEVAWKSLFPRGSVLEALGTELPTSLLQSAAASSSVQESRSSTLGERPNAGKTACGVTSKQTVRKRKAAAPALRPTQAARECRLESSPAKLRQAPAVSAPGVTPLSPQSSTAATPRATTTKAQLLRWDTEARKLPRIPHLNYNRVLGRWYARVRDPASGRRIWKGYTCAVHGFYQARDMAIDRLRQFSQLVAPTEALLHTASSASDGMDCAQSPPPECADTAESALLSDSRNSFEAPEFTPDEINPTVHEVDAILKAGMGISESSEKATAVEDCPVGHVGEDATANSFSETTIQVTATLAPKTQVRSGFVGEGGTAAIEQPMVQRGRHFLGKCQESTKHSECTREGPQTEGATKVELHGEVEKHGNSVSSCVVSTLAENSTSSRLSTADSLDISLACGGCYDAQQELSTT